MSKTSLDPESCRQEIIQAQHEFPGMPNPSLAEEIANRTPFVSIVPDTTMAIIDQDGDVAYVQKPAWMIENEANALQEHNLLLLENALGAFRNEVGLQIDNSRNMSLAGCAPTAEFSANMNKKTGPRSKASLSKKEPEHWTTIAMVVILLTVIAWITISALGAMP